MVEVAQPQGTSRRTAICEAALDLAATGGNRAVTHHAIDDRLGISRGSASYYFRTRRDLLDATIGYLTDASKTAFLKAMDGVPALASTGDPRADAAAFVARQVDMLIGERRRDALARYALATDVPDELRGALAGCLFSVSAASALMTSFEAAQPLSAAHDFVSLLEGLLFDRLCGSRSLLEIEAGTQASRADLQAPIYRWLTALTPSC